MAGAEAMPPELYYNEGHLYGNRVLRFLGAGILWPALFGLVS